MSEAQQAHYYGLSDNLALAAVTTTPAAVLGLDHRIGLVKSGYDAGMDTIFMPSTFSNLIPLCIDIVVWDSHPLALGATPKLVFIDGIAQLEKPFSVTKPVGSQQAPLTPNFDKETKAAIRYEGLPPLEPTKAGSDIVLFTNVGSIHIRHNDTIREVSLTAQGLTTGDVVVENGIVTCTGLCSVPSGAKGVERVNLEGGSIS